MCWHHVWELCLSGTTEPIKPIHSNKLSRADRTLRRSICLFLCCNIVFEEARMMETVPESGLKKKGCVKGGPKV